MMIHVNLHPKRGKGSAGSAGGSSLARAIGGMGAAVARARAGVTDRYLFGAAVTVAAAVAGVAYLHTSQGEAEAQLVAREEAATRDSARYSALIVAQKNATARRDSLAGQLRVIAAIDSNRYVWAHVLDEMSRALPQYTWLTAVQQTSAPPTPPGTDSVAAEGKGKGKKKEEDAPVAAPVRQAMRFRVVGHTVDIQALTMFMRDLEASPFVRNVQLAQSQAVVADGKDVTEFTLDAEFQAAPRSVLRTESITVQVR